MILGIGAGISVLAMLGGGRRSNKLFKGFGRYAKWKIMQTLKQLRLRGYIEFDEADERAPIVLTKRGMQRFFRYNLSDMLRGKIKKWDYLWRMVIFDIPNKKKISREAFRRALISLGFYPLQKSVFVSPHKCEKEMITLSKMYGVAAHMLILTVASLGPREQSVRKYFFDK